MSLKRTHDQMTATGSEPSALDSCTRGEHMVSFARDRRAIKIRFGPRAASRGSIYIPYELLCSVSWRNYDEFHCPGEGKAVPEMWLPDLHCPDVHDLFLQWLYTGKYTELRGPVLRLSCKDDTPDLNMCPDLDRNETMDWAVKAAILAWYLGDNLEVRGFQNHAMTRLSAALSHRSEQPQLTEALYSFVWENDEGNDSLEWALADLIVRNWGDAAVVDQTDLTSWALAINSVDHFTEKFFEGSLLSLEQRREKILVAEDYFL